MTHSITRIGLAVAGAALAAGTTLGAAATPAQAAAPQHGAPATSPRWDDGGSDGASWDSGRSWVRGDSWDSGATWSAGASWQRGSSYSRGHGWDRSGGWGWDNGDRGGDRTAGFLRSYGACQRAGYWGTVRGDWDDFSCDFTRRGGNGWDDYGFGGNDWRCGGTWVLRVDSLDEN